MHVDAAVSLMAALRIDFAAAGEAAAFDRARPPPPPPTLKERTKEEYIV